MTVWGDYTIHQSLPVTTDGMCLQGYMLATKSDIVAKLGNPIDRTSDSHKIHYEWVVTCGDTVLTIYDYYPSSQFHSNTLYYWHLGGRDANACALAEQLFPRFRHLGVREGMEEQNRFST